MNAGGRISISSLALYVDTERPDVLAAARNIASIANESGVGLVLSPEQAAALSLNGAGAKTFPSPADLLVSMGGDGTLLRAAHLAAPLGIPVVGVDFGRVGFLTEVDRESFDRVIRGLLKDGIDTENRTALEARLVGGAERYFAVNDIYLDRSQRGNIVTFGISISGEQVADIPADGIVVASPTGSTAYFLSAGGPIMAPGLDAFGIAPISPHTLFSRPLVVSASERIRISLPADSRGANLYADGKLETAVPPGSIVEIVRAEKPVKFARLDKHHFFTMLERKLHWGTSLKRSLEKGS
jgi:NAD+ kinase